MHRSRESLKPHLRFKTLHITQLTLLSSIVNSTRRMITSYLGHVVHLQLPGSHLQLAPHPHSFLPAFINVSFNQQPSSPHIMF